MLKDNITKDRTDGFAFVLLMELEDFGPDFSCRHTLNIHVLYLGQGDIPEFKKQF
jgi:hypothetical protein